MKRRPALDLLEERRLLATFAGSGPLLTITLNHAGESVRVVSDGATYKVISNFDAARNRHDPTGGHVRGFGTTTARIDVSAYSRVVIQDRAARTSVKFADSGAQTYTAGFTVKLDHDRGVRFTGSTNFAGAGLTVSAGGPIKTAAGSSLNLSGAGSNLSLTSLAHATNLGGSIACSGTTTLTSNGGPLSLGAIQASGLGATAAGFITQTGPVTAETASFTTVGDYGITLTNPANAIGTVSLNNPGADATSPSAVDFVDGGTVTLGDCALGLGTFSVTSVHGDIAQSGAMTQPVGAGNVRFTAGGTAIALGGKNDFSGQTVFGGDHVTAVMLRNIDPQATVPDRASLPSALQDLTLTFDNAPATLTDLRLVNLSVTAQGIDEASHNALKVSGTASFNSGPFEISLGDSGDLTHLNVFHTLALTTTGQAGVNVFAQGDTSLGNLNLGPGGLAIVALGGKITQEPGTAITHLKSLTSVIYGQDGVELSSPDNQIPGVLTLFDPSGNFPHVINGDVTLNAESDLHLGIVITTGNLSVTSATGPISASSLQVSGDTTFRGGGALDLATSGNNFGGTVSLSGGDVALLAASRVRLGACDVTSLTVTANSGQPASGFAQGDITQASGTAMAVGQATFDAGSFGMNVNLKAQGTAPIPLSLKVGATTSVTASAPIVLGNVAVNAGDLRVTAVTAISQQADGTIIQNGTGTVTLIANGAGSVKLDSTSGNAFTNPVVVQAGDVTVDIASGASFSFDAGSTITGALEVTGSGTFRVPTALTVKSLDSSAASTLVESDITTTSGDINFGAPVVFSPGAGGLTVQTGKNSGVQFGAGVRANGALTFETGTGTVTLVNGTWDQGANALTLSGSLEIGTNVIVLSNAPPSPPTLILGGGQVTLNGTNTNRLTVESDGTLQVLGGAETLINQNVPVAFAAGARLGIDFAAALNVTGAGLVSIDGALLFGTGLAGAKSTAILTAPNGSINGVFAGSEDGNNKPIPFLAESDIVTLAYSTTAVNVTEAGVVALNGVATGLLPNGDTYSVTASLGQLVVIADGNRLDVVVRPNSGSGASTLTIGVTGSTPTVDVGGIVVYGDTNVVIQAPTANLVGDLLVNPNVTAAGALTSLTLGDAIDTNLFHPLLIQSGGPATASTSITGKAFKGVRIEVGGLLQSLTLDSFVGSGPSNPGSSASAQSFDTIAVTGDLNAHLSNTLSSPSAIGTVTVGGTLSNTWLIYGGIGTVSAATANGWTLDDPSSAIGRVQINGAATNATVSAGSINTLQATGWNGGLLAFHATTGPAIGSLKIGTAGLTDATIDGRTGAGQTTVAESLTVTGNISNTSLSFAGGTVGRLIVGGDWDKSSLVTDAIGSLLVNGAVNRANIDGQRGSFEIQGSLDPSANPVVGTFHVVGPFNDSTFEVLKGDAGTLLFDSLVSGSHLQVDTGNVTQQLVMTAGVTNSTIDAGNMIANLVSGPWTSTSLLTQLLGTMQINGDLTGTPENSSRINAASNTGGTSPPLAIHSFTVTGNITDASLTFRNGVGSFTAGTATGGGVITNSSIVVDNSNASVTQIGKIAQMNAAALICTTINATTLGTVTIQGDVVNSNIFASGRGEADTQGTFDVQSLTVQGDWMNTPLLTGMGQVGTLAIAGIVTDSAFTIGGPLTSFTVGQWLGSQLSGVTIATFLVGGNTARNLPGNFANDAHGPSVLSISSAVGSIATFEVNGNLQGSRIDVLPGVQNFVIRGAVQNSVLAVAYAPGASIGLLAAGAWQNTPLTTNAISTWQVGGDLSGSLINILGNAGGASPLALGAFSAGGTVGQSTFQVAAGNVGSFVAGRFFQSALLAGYRLPRPFDLKAFRSSPSLYWTANLSLGQFRTTGPGVSFAKSNVAAAKLGAIRLSGVAAVVPSPMISYGVLFRRSTGLGGPIVVHGRKVPPGFQRGAFVYDRQSGLITTVTVPAASGVSGQPLVLRATVAL